MVRTLLISLFTLALTHADDTLSLRTLATDKGEMPTWHVQVSEDEYVKVEWPDSQPSAAIKIPTGKELQLCEQAADEEGEAKYKAAMKVAIPEGTKEVLLLGSAGGDDGAVKVVAIPDLYSQAKFNDWLVINQSTRMVTLRFGKDNDAIELEAGSSGIYKIEGEPGKGGEVVAEAKIKDGSMRKIYSTYWSPSEKQRALILFTDDRGAVKVRRVIDFLPLN